MGKTVKSGNLTLLLGVPGEEEDLFAISREQAKQYAWANPNAVGAAAGAIAGTNESRPLNV